MTKVGSPLSHILAGVLGGLASLVVGAVLIATDVIDTGDDRTVLRQSPIASPALDDGGAGGRTVQDIYEKEGAGVVFIEASGVAAEQSPCSGSRPRRGPPPAPASWWTTAASSSRTLTWWMARTR